jgi:hypothetical protein
MIVHLRHNNGKEPTRCDKLRSFINCTPDDGNIGARNMLRQ